MRFLLRVSAAALLTYTASIAIGCGGKVFVDPPGTGGGSSTNGGEGSGVKKGSCKNKACGDSCSVCKGGDCTDGVCDPDGTCTTDFTKGCVD